MQPALNEDIASSAKLSQVDVLLVLAIALFREERVTLVQAAKLAGIDRLTFQHQLAARQIPIHYDEDELDVDLRTISSL